MTAPVQQGVTFTIPGASGPAIEGPFTLFTVPNAVPAMINSVTLTADYGGQTTNGDIFILELIDISGLVISKQPTPLLLNDPDASDPGLVFMSWYRGANDTAQLPMFGTVQNEGGDVPWAWCALPLPELVLQPNSTVALTMARDYTNPEGDVIISNISITYTPNNSAATTVPADLTPYLLPTVPTG